MEGIGIRLPCLAAFTAGGVGDLLPCLDALTMDKSCPLRSFVALTMLRRDGLRPVEETGDAVRSDTAGGAGFLASASLSLNTGGGVPGGRPWISGLEAWLDDVEETTGPLSVPWAILDRAETPCDEVDAVEVLG